MAEQVVFWPISLVRFPRLSGLESQFTVLDDSESTASVAEIFKRGEPFIGRRIEVNCIDGFIAPELSQFLGVRRHCKVSANPFTGMHAL